MADPEDRQGRSSNGLERPRRRAGTGVMTELDAAFVSVTAPAASGAQSDTGAHTANRVAGMAALAMPLLVLLAFIASYARPMPVTDEWFFLRAVVALEQVSWTNLPRILQL